MQIPGPPAECNKSEPLSYTGQELEFSLALQRHSYSLLTLRNLNQSQHFPCTAQLMEYSN